MLAGLALPAAAQTQTSACSAISLGDLGALNGWVPSPNDAWHQDISALPVDPNSTKIMTTSGDLANRYLHPDFSNVADGSYGIPYTVLDSTGMQLVPITPADTGDSDNTLYPITPTTPIEGSPGECWTDGNYDHHAIMIDRTTCVAYEVYQADLCNGQWTSYGNVIWDFTLPAGEKRPYGVSSVDAAGLSVFEGLLRYDEIAAGVVNHAIRFTAYHTKADNANGYFTAPATHAAGSSWGTDNIIGMRIRLKPGFDISTYSPTNQIILTAMKKYGMILADNGADMFFQGTPDPRWDDNDITKLKAIPSTAFEVVQMNPVYDAYTAPTGAAPAIASFTASANNVAPGTPVVLTPAVTGGSYEFVDAAGFTRGPITVNPTVTTTYTLYSRNEYDTSTASVTVVVQDNGSHLAFNPIPAQNYGAPPFTVSVTSLSSGAVTYTVVSGPATVSGNTVTLTGIGTVSLQATQAAAGSYPATSVVTSFAVSGPSPTLSFNAIANQAYGNPPVAVSVTSNSSGAVTYSVVSGPATVSGNLVTLTAGGHVTLMATQAAAGAYGTGTATTSFDVSGPSTDLAFVAIATQQVGAAPFRLSVTSNSTGVVTFALVSGPALVFGNSCTVTGAGSVTVEAIQAADGVYPAATAFITFNVVGAGTAPNLAFTAIASQTYGAAPFVVSATSNSPGAITYSVLSGPATIAGSTVTLTGAGTVTLQATQAQSGSYSAATATTSFNVAGVSPSLSFTAIANQTYGAAPFSVSATSNSPGAITYSVLSGPATIAGSTVTLTGAGTVTLQASQAASGGYSAATATTSFNVAGSAPTLSFTTVTSQTFGASPFAVSATSNSPGAITYSVLSGPATIAGSTVTLTGAGTVTLQASQAASGGYSAATATTSFNVAAASPGLAIAPIANQTYGNPPVTLSATSSSTGAITYTLLTGPATISGNILTLTGAGTVTVQATQAAAGGYTAATASVTFSVAGAAPTLSFTPIANQINGAAPFPVSATSNSTGTITYSVVSGPATLSGNLVSITGVGTVTLQATQAATGAYAAATVTTSFSVTGSGPTLTFNPIANQIFGALPFAVSASSNSPAPIVYTVLSGPATIAGNIVTLTGVGTVSLQASQAASGGFAAASAIMSFSVGNAASTLAFNPIVNQTFGAAPFAISATSNSPAPITYSVLSGPATLAGNILTLTGAGGVTVEASQAASNGYAASRVTASFSVSPATPSLVFQSIAAQTFGTPPFTVSATSNSPGAITYTVLSGPATVAGSVITLTGAGTVVLQASQAASTGFSAATVTTSFNVTAIASTLSFAPIPAKTFGSAPFAIAASSNSPSPITYAVLSGPATITGNIVTLTGVGQVTLAASQTAGAGYAAGQAVTSFSVNAATTTLTIPTIPTQTFGGAPLALAATSNSPGTITWSVVSGQAIVLGNTVSFTAVGPVTLQATQAGSGSFLPATATVSFTVDPAVPSLKIASIPTQTFGAGPVTVSATSNSSAPITYTVLSGPASLSGATLTLNGTGTVTLQASQSPAGNYLGATATTSFTIAPSSVVLAGDFALPNNITITMNQGDSKTVTVPLSAINGFNGQIAFQCTVPAAMTFGVCNATTAQLASNAPGSSDVTITTRGSNQTAEERGAPLHPGTKGLIVLASLLPFGLPFVRRRKITLRRFTLGMLCALSLGAVSMATTGCGAMILNSLTPAGTYVLNVNASSGSTAHAMTITVIVQQPKN
ncbi:MAG: hypothetical protein M3O02_06445 [Acidobacteriota bacterium]|nr:hypothetical protein [Acidobacteriota bacterium]